MIQLHALSFGIGIVEPAVIDEINILQATFQAFAIALSQLSPKPHLCLIDGNQKFPTSIPQKAIIKGDNRVFSVAAASIIAKVTRDRLMIELDKELPEYGFSIHKGYGTELHMKAIEDFGPSPLHRRSFAMPQKRT